MSGERGCPGKARPPAGRCRHRLRRHGNRQGDAEYPGLEFIGPDRHQLYAVGQRPVKHLHVFPPFWEYLNIIHHFSPFDTLFFPRPLILIFSPYGPNYAGNTQIPVCSFPLLAATAGDMLHCAHQKEVTYYVSREFKGPAQRSRAVPGGTSCPAERCTANHFKMGKKACPCRTRLCSSGWPRCWTLR